MTAMSSQDGWIFKYSPKSPKFKLSVEIPEAEGQHKPQPTIPQDLRTKNLHELGEEKDSSGDPKPTQNLPCQVALLGTLKRTDWAGRLASTNTDTPRRPGNQLRVASVYS